LLEDIFGDQKADPLDLLEFVPRHRLDLVLPGRRQLLDLDLRPGGSAVQGCRTPAREKQKKVGEAHWFLQVATDRIGESPDGTGTTTRMHHASLPTTQLLCGKATARGNADGWFAFIPPISGQRGLHPDAKSGKSVPAFQAHICGRPWRGHESESPAGRRPAPGNRP